MNSVTFLINFCDLIHLGTLLLLNLHHLTQVEIKKKHYLDTAERELK